MNSVQFEAISYLHSYVRRQHLTEQVIKHRDLVYQYERADKGLVSQYIQQACQTDAESLNIARNAHFMRMADCWDNGQSVHWSLRKGSVIL